MLILVGILFVVFGLFLLFSMQNERAAIAQQPQQAAPKTGGFFGSFSCKIGLFNAVLTLTVYLIFSVLSSFKMSPEQQFLIGISSVILIFLVVCVILPIIILIGVIVSVLEVTRGETRYSVIGFMINISVAAVLVMEYLYRQSLR